MIKPYAMRCDAMQWHSKCTLNYSNKPARKMNTCISQIVVVRASFEELICSRRFMQCAVHVYVLHIGRTLECIELKIAEIHINFPIECKDFAIWYVRMFEWLSVHCAHTHTHTISLLNMFTCHSLCAKWWLFGLCNWQTITVAAMS